MTKPDCVLERTLYLVTEGQGSVEDSFCLYVWGSLHTRIEGVPIDVRLHLRRVNGCLFTAVPIVLNAALKYLTELRITQDEALLNKLTVFVWLALISGSTSHPIYTFPNTRRRWSGLWSSDTVGTHLMHKNIFNEMQHVSFKYDKELYSSFISRFVLSIIFWKISLRKIYFKEKIYFAFKRRWNLCERWQSNRIKVFKVCRNMPIWFVYRDQQGVFCLRQSVQSGPCWWSGSLAAYQPLPTLQAGEPRACLVCFF